ncbi:MAG: Holliday junction resolvase RuvX [Verrucomicrobiota bacterium]
MSDWVKAMGIDYGTARIGLAVSDDLGLLAHPLETVPAHDTDSAIERIAEITRSRKIESLIIGLPLHINGSEGEAVQKVRRFTAILRQSISKEVRFHEVDERFTTKVAMEKLHDAGRTEKDARQIIDQAAAVEILQQWLDQQAGRA